MNGQSETYAGPVAQGTRAARHLATSVPIGIESIDLALFHDWIRDHDTNRLATDTLHYSPRLTRTSAMSAYGVQWKREGLIPTPTPEWTVEPETDIIRDVVQRYLPRDTAITDVMLYGQGGLNKVYKISTTNLSYALRVSLPLSVPDKVESEVATMTFLAKNVSSDRSESTIGLDF